MSEALSLHHEVQSKLFFNLLANELCKCCRTSPSIKKAFSYKKNYFCCDPATSGDATAMFFQILSDKQFPSSSNFATSEGVTMHM